MPAHQRVRTWIAQNYQRPAIDQEWLADCSDWLSSELCLDPDKDFDEFIQHVEAQLLQSNLADSTVPGSGIDPLLVVPNPNPARPRTSGIRRSGHLAPRRETTTGPIPLLVEIKSITEIAHSAFSLLNTHQTRVDRADLGLAHEENAEQHHDEDEGPVPRYPRGMLRFKLSDGVTAFRAIEYRPLPQLELGTTPLGYKLFLKTTPIRNGIAFLEPANVILKGYRTEDHDINSEQVFLSSLRKRLGRPDPPPEVPVAGQRRINSPVELAPVQSARQRELPLIAQPQSPPTDYDDMYVDDDIDPDVLREMAIQIDEVIDARQNQYQRAGTRSEQTATFPSTLKEQHVTSSVAKQTSSLHTTVAAPSLKAPPTSSTVKTSPYFTAHPSGSESIPDIGLSPRPALSPNLEFNLDNTDADDPEQSNLPVRKFDSASARPPSTVSANHVPPDKRPASPDPYDDLSLDMDVDESFFEQVGMIEVGALGANPGSKGKGKGKDVDAEGTAPYGRLSVAPSRKTPSDSAPGMKPLAKCPVSPLGAKSSTKIQDSMKRATEASLSSSSAEPLIPKSTRSSDRRVPRGPSLTVISSDDEALVGRNMGRPLGIARRHARKIMDQDELADSDVIDISD